MYFADNNSEDTCENSYLEEDVAGSSVQDDNRVRLLVLRIRVQHLAGLASYHLLAHCFTHPRHRALRCSDRVTQASPYSETPNPSLLVALQEWTCLQEQEAETSVMIAEFCTWSRRVRNKTVTFQRLGSWKVWSPHTSILYCTRLQGRDDDPDLILSTLWFTWRWELSQHS